MPTGDSCLEPPACPRRANRPARDSLARSIRFELESRRQASMPASPPDRLLPELFPGLTLLANERLLSSLHIDIDDQLRFSPGLLLLSDAHVHVRHREGG